MADQAKMRAIEIFNSDVQKVIQELPQQVETVNGLPRISPKWLQPEYTPRGSETLGRIDILGGLGIKVSHNAKTELGNVSAAGVPQDFLSLDNLKLALRLGENPDDIAAAVQLKYVIDAENTATPARLPFGMTRNHMPASVVEEQWVALQNTPQWKSVAALAANAEKNFDEQAAFVQKVRNGADSFLPRSAAQLDDEAGLEAGYRVTAKRAENFLDNIYHARDRMSKLSVSAPILGLLSNSTGILVAGKDADERIQPYLRNGTVNQDAAGDYRYAAMQAKAIELATGFPELGSSAYKSWAETHHVPLKALAELDTTGVTQIDIQVNPLRTLTQEYLS